MAVELTNTNLILLGNGGYYSEEEDLDTALSTAEFLAEPEHSVAEYAYVVPVIKVAYVA